MNILNHLKLKIGINKLKIIVIGLRYAGLLKVFFVKDIELIS